jgi:hypothetical protein
MKREIVCQKCGAEPLGVYPGEWNHKEKGQALRDFICDLCGLGIPRGCLCVAVSMGLDRQPWHPWESEYIKK